MRGGDFEAEAAKLFSPTMGTEMVGPLLYDLVMMTRPKRVLEIGAGYTSLFLLQALADAEAKEDAECAGTSAPTATLLQDYLQAPRMPPQLHVIDDLSHGKTTADQLEASAQRLGIHQPLTMHVADFIGYADKLPAEAFPFDLVWLDCGRLDLLQHFRTAYWPLVNKNGGLILIHSLSTNFHGQMFLSELRLSQATTHFNAYEMITLLEPHKARQNSVTMIRVTEKLATRIHTTQA